MTMARFIASLVEAGDEESVEAAKKGCDWLIDRQILEVKGDWIKKAPDLRRPSPRWLGLPILE